MKKLLALALCAGFLFGGCQSASKQEPKQPKPAVVADAASDKADAKSDVAADAKSDASSDAHSDGASDGKSDK